MPQILRVFLLVQFIFIMSVPPAHASPGLCQRLLESAKTVTSIEWLKKEAIDKTLDVIALMKGLPKYKKQNNELRDSRRYLEYDNFGDMGLAEIGISVRYNQANFNAMNTGKPLIIVANHHLGIADGLTIQYLASKARKSTPTLLFLARWIEKLMPHAVFGDENRWGTAIPVEINMPQKSDPNFDAKMAEVKGFNSTWSRVYTRILKNDGAAIIFPAGHVAAINEGESYPKGVYDAPDSWQDGFLNLARLGKADIVFANLDSVNSEAFYRKRKRFGGGDKERVLWFFSEAVAKRDKNIDVYLSKPMSLDDIYSTFSEKFGHSVETLKADPRLTAELMRQYTYKLPEWAPQELDGKDSPEKKPKSEVAR